MGSVTFEHLYVLIKTLEPIVVKDPGWKVPCVNKTLGFSKKDGGSGNTADINCFHSNT